MDTGEGLPCLTSSLRNDLIRAQAGRRIILKVKTKGKLKRQTLETLKTSAAARVLETGGPKGTLSFQVALAVKSPPATGGDG